MQQKASSSIDMTSRYPSKVEESPHYEKKAKDLAVDFLSKVREHVTTTLRAQYGRAAFDALEVRWMMTVPAIWSLEAKSTTKQCAEAAGMGTRDTLLMTSEPEAAAVYALRKLEPHHLQEGNNIIILDAGGGTVDLVSYRIKQLKPFLQVEESGVCSGGKCGGVFLNRVFEDMLDKKLAANGKDIPDDGRFELRKQFETFVCQITPLC